MDDVKEEEPNIKSIFLDDTGIDVEAEEGAGAGVAEAGEEALSGVKQVSFVAGFCVTELAVDNGVVERKDKEGVWSSVASLSMS